MGFPRKKVYPPVEDIIFFEIGFQSQFYVEPPGIFHFFALTPLEILVFPSNFDIPPFEFQLLSLYPLEISTEEGGFKFFLEKTQCLIWWFFLLLIYLHRYPYDDTRVRLSQRPGVEGSDYINANYIDSYGCKDYFIATQAPLESTIGDFWRMIWEQNCGTIVMLSKEFEGQQVSL